MLTFWRLGPAPALLRIESCVQWGPRLRRIHTPIFWTRSSMTPVKDFRIIKPEWHSRCWTSRRTSENKTMKRVVLTL
ncbi:hypothetical protein ACN42_g10621 [Penicillium freii]|uniref:Uncharacterized protein n=1 Tax=Penicillium freii TaxID=48697 RepID=A0A101M9S7_PENFR|nr:hypothetical protein ACN42_g10621 [Penicillium freii]